MPDADDWIWLSARLAKTAPQQQIKRDHRTLPRITAKRRRLGFRKARQ